MASRFITLALACALFVVSARSAEENSYELRKNTNTSSQEVPNQPGNQLQQEQQQKPGLQQQQSNQLQLEDSTESDDDDDSSGPFGGNNDIFPMPFFGQQQQQGMPNPMNPLGFFGHIMNNFRNQHENFNRQFQQMQQQAANGEEITHFMRNGVGYTRVCKTRRDD